MARSRIENKLSGVVQVVSAHCDPFSFTNFWDVLLTSSGRMNDKWTLLSIPVVPLVY